MILLSRQQKILINSIVNEMDYGKYNKEWLEEQLALMYSRTKNPETKELVGDTYATVKNYEGRDFDRQIPFLVI